MIASCEEDAGAGLQGADLQQDDVGAGLLDGLKKGDLIQENGCILRPACALRRGW
jgi:hypothetical protein